MVQSAVNKPKRVQHSAFCGTLSDVILKGECSVKIEPYPRRSLRKAGKHCHNKG